MSAPIHADDGDELYVRACSLFDEQAIVRIDLENRCHSDVSEFDWLTLSIDQARALARALSVAADVAESATLRAA